MLGRERVVGDFVPRLPSPMEELADRRIAERGVRLLLKRDDLVHPEVAGNKWRKLKHNLDAAREQHQQALLTFGGAYSNHIRAVAAAGRYFGFRTVGVIRGERTEPLNWSLNYVVSRGMELAYLDRETYRHKHEPKVLDSLRERFGEFYLLPEGGTNPLAVRGCAELATEIDTEFDVISCSCGTGGTLAGIAAGLRPGQHALGFAALKGGQFLVDDVADLQRQTFGSPTENWSIDVNFHFGGFAKRTPDLDDFIVHFEQRHGLELDWVYVAKMLFGIFTLVDDGRFERGTTIVAVITGPGEQHEGEHDVAVGLERRQAELGDEVRADIHPA